MYEQDKPRWYVTEFPHRYEVQLLTKEEIQHILDQTNLPFYYARINYDYFVQVNDKLTQFTWDEGEYDERILKTVDVLDTKFYWTGDETIEFALDDVKYTLSLEYTKTEDIDLKQLVESMNG
jgi:hypothetical protein